jgi:short subunit dehydrogenase-like uncharacterized protein
LKRVSARIVLFGATGYTGELTARALVARGVRPVLAARSRARVEALAAELGGLESAVADVAAPRTVRALVEPGDVLVSTVGPFARWGAPAVEAAIDAGAHYLDSTGEATFIRSVFERYGPAAAAAGCGLLTAFGYDWVPGNLAGALALREAGAGAARVEVAYFISGGALTSSAMSGGTRASAAGVMLERGFAWRGGRLVVERGARRARAFEVAPGRSEMAISAAASEHFALPRLAPGLREVDAYLGWFGPLSRPMQALSVATTGLGLVPGVKPALQGLTARFVKGSTGGPDEAARARTGSIVLGRAYDAAGRQLSAVRLEGVNAYTFTGAVLAWGAQAAAAGGLRGSGALGPADGFGVDELEAGVAEAGIARA